MMASEFQFFKTKSKYEGRRCDSSCGSEIDSREEVRLTPVHDAMISVSCFRIENYIVDEVEDCDLTSIMEVVCMLSLQIINCSVLCSGSVTEPRVRRSRATA